MIVSSTYILASTASNAPSSVCFSPQRTSVAVTQCKPKHSEGCTSCLWYLLSCDRSWPARDSTIHARIVNHSLLVSVLNSRKKLFSTMSTEYPKRPQQVAGILCATSEIVGYFRYETPGTLGQLTWLHNECCLLSSGSQANLSDAHAYPCEMLQELAHRKLGNWIILHPRVISRFENLKYLVFQIHLNDTNPYRQWSDTIANDSWAASWVMIASSSRYANHIHLRGHRLKHSQLRITTCWSKFDTHSQDCLRNPDLGFERHTRRDCPRHMVSLFLFVRWLCDSLHSMYEENKIPASYWKLS